MPKFDHDHSFILIALNLPTFLYEDFVFDDDDDDEDVLVQESLDCGSCSHFLRDDTLRWEMTSN